MNRLWKLVLPVPDESGADYLVMEDDSDETGGTFIYYLSTTNPKLGFDDWYESFDVAQSIALDYGCQLSDWKPIIRSEI